LDGEAGLAVKPKDAAIGVLSSFSVSFFSSRTDRDDGLIGDPYWIGFGFSSGRVKGNFPFLAEAVSGRVDCGTSTGATG
jgi:hypothetical protein